MREIKFRMKDYSGQWYYFGLGNATMTTEETLGQFTGLKDKNGVEIYEGDMMKHNDYMFVIRFHEGKFGYWYYSEEEKSKFYFVEINCERCKKAEVVGNIHDNPELLKGGKQ